MKYCPACKMAYQDTQTTCPVDGMPLHPVSGSSNPTNDLEKDVLDNVLSGYKRGIDNKLLANNLYKVPVDVYVKPSTGELSIRVPQGGEQGKDIYVYTSAQMFNNLPFSEQIKMFAGEYYKKTGKILMQEWSLKDIVNVCDELGATGINVNTACEKFAFYLSAKDAKAVLHQEQNQASAQAGMPAQPSIGPLDPRVQQLINNWNDIARQGHENFLLKLGNIIR